MLKFAARMLRSGPLAIDRNKLRRSASSSQRKTCGLIVVP
jgi:hypothetical protein